MFFDEGKTCQKFEASHGRSKYHDGETGEVREVVTCSKHEDIS